MTTRIRRLALASAALLLTSAAQAAAVKWTVSIDFETYPNGDDVKAFSSTDSSDFPSGVPAGDYGSVEFSKGASIYPIALTGPLRNKPESNGSNGGDGYLSNDLSTISIAVDKALEIEFLAFDFSYEAAPGVKVVGTSGDVALGLVGGGWDFGWRTYTNDPDHPNCKKKNPTDPLPPGCLDLSSIGHLTSIDFSFSPTSQGLYFALDNLRLGINDPGTGKVPEPSGIALAALALAAAASASRAAGKGR